MEYSEEQLKALQEVLLHANKVHSNRCAVGIRDDLYVDKVNYLCALWPEVLAFRYSSTEEK